MTKSLKRIAEPDTFNYGKAVTLILSHGTAISFAGTTTRTGLSGAVVDCNFFYK